MKAIPIVTSVAVGMMIDAKIIAFEVSECGIRCRISWWTKDERKTEWVESCEVSLDPFVKMEKIGFSK